MCFMSNLNNSRLSAQCFDVETITIGLDYVYKLITNENKGPGEYVIYGFELLPFMEVLQYYYNIIISLQISTAHQLVRMSLLMREA